MWSDKIWRLDSTALCNDNRKEKVNKTKTLNAQHTLAGKSLQSLHN